MEENYFGRQAARYKAVRPQYPEDLFAFLAGQVSNHDLAVDCGCGSGQATASLARHFSQVVGIDESVRQLSFAERRHNIRYVQASTARMPLKDAVSDLVTAATAIHWFDLDRFYNEASCILKPDGVMAAWTYYIVNVDPKVDAMTKDFFEKGLAHLLDERRRLIMDQYATLPFPFSEKQNRSFTWCVEGNFSTFTDILRSSHLVQREIERTGNDPVKSIESDLKRAWGREEKRPLKWDISLVAGRKSLNKVTHHAVPSGRP